jgi:hypothetical protein
MDLLTTGTLKELIQIENNPCVSIYIPTFMRGAEAEQNGIRFKNAVRDTEKLLFEKGFRSLQVNDLLTPAKRLIEDTFFWNHQSSGLAVFFTFGSFYYYRLPYSFEEMINVNNRFYIKPLLRVFSRNERFYVLALDKKHLKLFEGNRFTLNEADLQGIPANLQDALKIDETEQLKFQTSERGPHKQAMYTGPGFGTDDAYEIKEIKRFFQMVNTGVYNKIKKGNPPLILAGVEYLQPIYREANTYPNLLERGVTLNTDRMNETELHKLSWDIAESYFKKPFEEALFNFDQLYGTERTSSYFDDIIKAAFTGKIESLFINTSVKIWGSFDITNYNVSIHEKPRAGDEDLCDLAAIQTLLHNGAVYTIDQENMPAAKPLAAVFRY